MIGSHVIPAIGRVRLERLQPADVRRVHERILNTPKDAKNPDKGFLSSTYALNAHRVLAKALHDAEREGKIGRNPARLTDAPRKALPTLNALSVSEAIHVISRVVPAFDADVYDPEPARWATYLLTGARRGEVLGIETDRIGDVLDLSWQLQRITDISSAPSDYEYREIANGMYWTRPKSRAGWRIIPLVDPLRTILETHLGRSEANPHGLLFAGAEGLPIDPDTETKRWPRALAEMNVTDKHVRLHDLRHTTIDLLYEAGVPEDVIMEIAGQSTRSVTRGYKSRGNQKRLTEAMLQLSALIESR